MVDWDSHRHTSDTRDQFSLILHSMSQHRGPAIVSTEVTDLQSVRDGVSRSEWHFSGAQKRLAKLYRQMWKDWKDMMWNNESVQGIIGIIAREQSLAGADAIGILDIKGQKLQLSRPVSLPELRKHKRGFLKLSTQNNWLKVRNTENAQQLFVAYLSENLTP